VLLTVAVMAIGIGLPFSALGSVTGMVPLPWAYFPWLGLTLLAYCATAQAVKAWYIRRFAAWL
jgi:Mg2+-importing ATPase